MRIEIAGNPMEKIFDILKASENVKAPKFYSGKIHIHLQDEISRESLNRIKDEIIYNLAGTVKNYTMRVIN